MPIRLNLLAEAKAAEEERRRDPVKRAIWLGGLLIVSVLAWSSFLQLRTTLANSEVTRLEARISSRTNEYCGILNSASKLADVQHKLEALQKLSAERMLQGTLLNALQKTTVDDVQLVRLHIDQSYTAFEGEKSRTNGAGIFIPGKPPTRTEKILLTLEGTDSSANSGDALNKYKDALASNAYFKEALVKTNGISLKTLAAPTISAANGKPSASFTLECRYPDTTR